MGFPPSNDDESSLRGKKESVFLGDVGASSPPSPPDKGIVEAVLPILLSDADVVVAAVVDATSVWMELSSSSLSSPLAKSTCRQSGILY